MITAEVLAQILGQLGDVCDRCPELRFGQLLATIGMLAEDETGHSLWDVEDGDFAAALERFAADMARRGSSVAAPGVAPDRVGITSSPASTAPQSPRQVS
jgi:hypothetical protein